MEAIKNFLKPGSKDDDQALYDTGADPNKGKIAGEGTHFNNHGHTDSGVGGIASPIHTTNPTSGPSGSSTTNPTAGLTGSSTTNQTTGLTGSTVANPTAGVTGSSATKTAETAPTTGESRVPIGTASTTDERAFPLSNTGTGATAGPSSQTGAGLADRTVAGTVPAAAGTTATTTVQPTTSTTHQSTSPSAIPTTVGTTSSVQQGTAPQSQFSASNAQTIDSSAQPAADRPLDTVHGGPHVTQIARKIDPAYDETPGAAGISGLNSTSQPVTTSTSRSEALTPGAAGVATAAATGATGSSATRPVDPVASTSASRSVDPSTTNATSTHSAAIPAAVGAGAGLAGASAAGSAHTSGQTSAENYDGRPSVTGQTSTVPTTESSGIAGTSAGTAAGVAHPYSEKAVDPRIDSGNHAATSSQYKTLDPAVDQRAAPTTRGQEHHYGRDAALGGAAGAGAGAVAEHEYSKKEAEKQVKQQKELEKQQEHAQKEHEKDVKEHNKAIEKEQKQHEKEAEKEQKQHEKEVEKVEKKHEKEAEKEQKQHEKAIAKEEKQHEKEAKQHEKELEKERKQQEKAEKPGLLDRLLHRSDKKEDDHHTAEAAGAGVAAGAGAGALHEHDKHNKLHKDPPPGYASEPTKGYASQVTGGTGTTALAQGDENILPAGGVVGEPGATVPGTRYGSGHDERSAVGAQPEFIGNDPSQGLRRESVAIADGTVQSTTPYAPPPTKGYASHVTGGTGTTQLAEGNLDPVTNPTKANPLSEASQAPLSGYAAQVTGGTGTAQLAQGTQSHIPTTGMVPGRSGSVAGVTTETPYVDGPKAGTGKYADEVTGGTGTTQLAQGQLDEVAQPRGKSIAEKVEEALVLK